MTDAKSNLRISLILQRSRGFTGLNAAVLQEKDYVRKYWEDIAIKLTVRNSIEKLLTKRNDIRLADLGCGRGLLYIVEITESSDK